jgi:hypothetical protein
MLGTSKKSVPRKKTNVPKSGRRTGGGGWSLDKPKKIPMRIRNGKEQRWEGYLWEKVKAISVIDFLREYSTHQEAHKVDKKPLIEFIQTMNKIGELTDWTIALIGGGDGESHCFNNNVSIQMLKRTQKGSHTDRYSIGRLMSSRDEAIDLNSEAWNAALALTKEAWSKDPARSRRSKEEPNTPNGPAIRKIRGFGAEGVMKAPERGVLFLYVLDPERAEANFPINTPPIIAFGISFPGSNSGSTVKYEVNNVYWEQESDYA